MEQLNQIIQQVLEVSPPVALSLLINFAITFLRRAPKLEKWQLNLLAFLIGGIAYPFIADPTKIGFAVHNPLASEIVTGLLIGGFSIGSNQLFRNTLEKIGLTTNGNDTVIITKPIVPSDPEKK